MKTYCISDIHGQAETLIKLLNKFDIEQRFIFLGDYIDRGPESKGVLDILMNLPSKNVIFLKGNHEDMLLRWLDNKIDPLQWFQNGGYDTIISYGYIPTGENLDDIRKDFKKTFYNHLVFLNNLKLYYEDEKFIYVHAGINPKLSNWRKDKENSYIRIREKFYNYPHNEEKTIIFGHTQTKELGMEDNDIWFGDKKICIDGGAANGYGHNLNCLEINERGFREHQIKIKR
jgi:serine/threonine protein phosphatase 1